MATFLTTTDTSAAIERIIRESKEFLVLISAYVYPRLIHLDRLRDAAERNVRITLIFGKRPLDDKVRTEMEQVQNLHIYYLDELHAKCYFNEREAVVSSLNLLNSSEAKNREMGVLLSKVDDPKPYADCLIEARSILSAATDLSARRGAGQAYGQELQQAGQVQHRLLGWTSAKGHCIRCSSFIAFDTTKPLCLDCFKEWSKWSNRDYEEVYCHSCGKHRPTTLAKPLCKPCYRSGGL